jgi:hypothetical protein
MTLGEWIPMHNEDAQYSPFEVLLWLTKTEDFIGRDFVMEENGIKRYQKPENGLMCFLDTTAPGIFHGVTPLETDTEIITIVGGMGRKGNYVFTDR